MDAGSREVQWRSTTILSVRHAGEVALGGDGQVTMQSTVVKHGACKLRRLYQDEVLVGFAGAAGDAFTLLDRFSGKLDEYHGNLLRSAQELVREWRTDKMLRPLESLMLCCDREHTLLISGGGEVIEPDDGVIGIGSGGGYAAAAARALLGDAAQLSAGEMVKKSLLIAADICIYSNRQINVETLSAKSI